MIGIEGEIKDAVSLVGGGSVHVYAFGVQKQSRGLPEKHSLLPTHTQNKQRFPLKDTYVHKQKPTFGTVSRDASFPKQGKSRKGR